VVSKDYTVTSLAQANAKAQIDSFSGDPNSGVRLQGFSISAVEGEELAELSETAQRVWRNLKQLLLANRKTD
jgi:hypothetical protein